MSITIVCGKCGRRELYGIAERDGWVNEYLGRGDCYIRCPKCIVTKVISNRSKLGWDYSTSPTGEDAWSISLPTKPVHIGTYAQVLDAIDHDNSWALDRQSAYYTTTWFARYRGRWVRILAPDYLWDEVYNGKSISLIMEA